jgi:hypothetical protein
MKVLRLWTLDAASGFEAPPPGRKHDAMAKQIAGLARGDDPPLGPYLASYDPDGHGGAGAWTFTDDKAKAMTFADAGAAHECWRRVSRTHPKRIDGKPNRPLTRFNVVIEDA